MQTFEPYQSLNGFYDHIYVVSVRAAVERRIRFDQRFQGLKYEYFFGADKDQFTIDQLAGDLLPNATDDQLLATSFHRNTMTNTEGGTDDEEFRVAAVKDRADTTSQVWMGLTLGCAKCHSHKYDPISQREYYSFYGILNQTADSDKGDEFPTKMIPTLFQRAEVEVIQARIAELKKRISEVNVNAEETQWRNSFNLTDPGTIATLKPTNTDGISEASIQSKSNITGWSNC